MEEIYIQNNLSREKEIKAISKMQLIIMIILFLVLLVIEFKFLDTIKVEKGTSVQAQKVIEITNSMKINLLNIEIMSLDIKNKNVNKVGYELEKYKMNYDLLIQLDHNFSKDYNELKIFSENFSLWYDTFLKSEFQKNRNEDVIKLDDYFYEELNIAKQYLEKTFYNLHEIENKQYSILEKSNREIKKKEGIIKFLLVDIVIVVLFILAKLNRLQLKLLRKYKIAVEKDKLIIDSSNVSLWEFDIEADYFWYSETFFKVIKNNFGVTDFDYKIETFFSLIHPDDLEVIYNFKKYINNNSNDFFDSFFRIKKNTGEWIWIWMKGKNLNIDILKRKKLIVGTFTDVTIYKNMQLELEYMSFHDPLTGIYNRRFYEKKINEFSKGSLFSIIMIDVNGLKMINDSLGHSVGDEILIKSAYIIKNVITKQHILARIGGDEFVILLQYEDFKQTGLITSEINEAFKKESIGHIPLSISCGWATKKSKKDTVEKIFKRAEDRMYQNKAADKKSIRHKTINVIRQTLFEKSPREELHSQRVSKICKKIGEKLFLNTNQIVILEMGGLLHDIGKISIDKTILDKNDALDKEEWIQIKKHPIVSFNILSSISEYIEIAEVVQYHHERWDGTGYPFGLKGEDIPLEARIIGIVDAFDAMVSDRSYRKGMEKCKALNIIKSEAGNQFDPNMVRIFLEIMEDVE